MDVRKTGVGGMDWIHLAQYRSLTTLDVCSQKSSGHKAVKFGRNTYLHCDYNLTKNHSILRGLGCDLC
jgi:hypothetical protein